MSNENLSQTVTCGHCFNVSKMDIIGSVRDDNESLEVDVGYIVDSGTNYHVLKCPSCKKNNIVKYYWHDMMESEDEIIYEMIFPNNSKVPLGLPKNILKAYNAAERVKSTDVNAYAILLRRLLELVCLDRNAEGDTLAKMLKNLANRGEIPTKLVKVAQGLKDLGNIGAHAKLGELSEEEVPIIKALILAILDYIYSAPHLAQIAENKLAQLKNN